MKAISIYPLFFLALFFSFKASAQKEANNWYFGTRAGISFNSNPPTPLFGGQTGTFYGHASISDANGNLLFYTGSNNGTLYGLWNRNHQPMLNSNGMYFGGIMNNALIVPWPGQPHKYYFFTSQNPLITPINPSEIYSVIDMSLNNGLGDVTTTKNVVLTNLSKSDVISVKHRNSRDFWVIHQMDSINVFKAFLVSPSGISSSPIISRVSGILQGTPVQTRIKISPDGQTIAFSVQDGLSNNNLHVLNFDASTGIITYRYAFPIIDANNLEFSPDGTKLYCMRSLTQNTRTSTRLTQFDISFGSISSIMNNAKIIFQDSIFNNGHGYLQVGPDAKIYVTFPTSQSHLSVINRPNLNGTACRFVYNSFDIDPNNSGLTNNVGYYLPTFVQSYFYRPKVVMQQTCFGDTARFDLGNRAYVDSVEWNFGDPASGAFNTSKSFTPKHFYAAGGTYNVQAIVHFNYASDTVNQTIHIPTTIVKPNLGNDTTLCQGDTLRLQAYQFGATYEWQDSLTTDSVFVVTKPGQYWVQVTNGCGMRMDTINVYYDQPLSINLGSDTLLCPGQSLQLTVNASGGKVLWQDSSKVATFTVTEPGTYWAQISNSCGSWRDSITVNYQKPITANWLGQDTVICHNSSYQINGVSPYALSYLWQNGSTNPTFTTNVTGTFWLEINTVCGPVRDSVHITVSPTRFSDTTICTGDNFTLKAPPGLNYQWSTGDTTQQIRISKAGVYHVIIETTLGCFFTDSIVVKEERCFKEPFIANIITPNNDNLNDKFEPKGLESGTWVLNIYTRWGNLIYKNDHYTNQWPDAKISNGVYYYLLRNQQTGKTYKGWLEVSK